MRHLQRTDILRLHALMSRNLNIKRRLAVEDTLHLLQTAAAGLLDEEPDQDGHDQVQRGVEEEGVAAPGTLHVGGD